MKFICYLIAPCDFFSLTCQLCLMFMFLPLVTLSLVTLSVFQIVCYVVMLSLLTESETPVWGRFCMSAILSANSHVL